MSDQDPPTGLIKYDAMLLAIAEAHKVDEVKDIRDRAHAFELYSRQARDEEAERRCREIRLRAERKAGELLAEMEKAKGGRPPENQSTDTTGFEMHRSHDATGAKTLSELGVSKDQSSRWQKLAAVPQAEFEEALAGTEKPTTSGIISHWGPPPPRPTLSPEEASLVREGTILLSKWLNARRSVQSAEESIRHQDEPGFHRIMREALAYAERRIAELEGEMPAKPPGPQKPSLRVVN